MKKNWIALGAILAVAAVFAGYGVYTGKFKGGDVLDAGKVAASGGDPIKALCIKYVAENDVVIAPEGTAKAVSESVPGTPVVAPSGNEGATTTTVTPTGPVPLGMPLPDGAANGPNIEPE